MASVWIGYLRWYTSWLPYSKSDLSLNSHSHFHTIWFKDVSSPYTYPSMNTYIRLHSYIVIFTPNHPLAITNTFTLYIPATIERVQANFLPATTPHERKRVLSMTWITKEEKCKLTSTRKRNGNRRISRNEELVFFCNFRIFPIFFSTSYRPCKHAWK